MQRSHFANQADKRHKLFDEQHDFDKENDDDWCEFINPEEQPVRKVIDKKHTRVTEPFYAGELDDDYQV